MSVSQRWLTVRDGLLFEVLTQEYTIDSGLAMPEMKASCITSMPCCRKVCCYTPMT